MGGSSVDGSSALDGGGGHVEYRMMSRRERAVCGSLCACLAAAVLSAVAMVYLTVIVYLPARRELSLGLGAAAVMCTTVEKRHVRGDIEACRWNSCVEWCLSRGGGDCTHLYVSVRSNGTDVELRGCSRASTRECPSLDDEEERAANMRNCKEDHQCSRLESMFTCSDGLCRNITGAHACRYEEEDAAPAPGVSCAKKRNCVELTGMFDCHRGRCRQVHKWSCERRCSGIPAGDADGAGVNVVLQSGDDVHSARCASAVNRKTGETIWRAQDHGTDLILLAHCTDVDTVLDDGSPPTVSATDCVNGTIIPSSWLTGSETATTTNLTTLQRVLHSPRGYLRRLDKHNSELPFEQDVTIFNRSRLMINSEGCVNTLVYECAAFHAFHDRDGRNQTSPAKFPCFYAPHDGQFVVRRFDPDRTKRVFLAFFMVPACVLILSCGSLFFCSRVLNIDNSGHMVFRRWKGGKKNKSNKGKVKTEDEYDDDEDQL